MFVGETGRVGTDRSDGRQIRYVRGAPVVLAATRQTNQAAMTNMRRKRQTVSQ